MGNSTSELGSKSTALEVMNHFVNDQTTSKDLSGKTIIVTGGNSGIGLETCKVFAYKGARVILASRSIKAGEEAIENEVIQDGNGGYKASKDNIRVMQLDLADLNSVKSFCDDILQTENRIDWLVLNAGIMALPTLEYTTAGFEKQIGVNHYGHFYLTSLLRKKIDSQKFPCRVISLTSTAHSMGTIDLNDLHYKNGRIYSSWSAYGQSKLANLLFAKELADQWKGTQFTACSVHPGVIQTNLWRSTQLSNDSWLSPILSIFLANKTIPQGAATTVYACLSPKIYEEERGAYLSDCHAITANKDGEDESGILRKGLWEATEADLNKISSK